MSQLIIRTNVRFHMDIEEDRRAWNYLKKMDRTRYKSYSRVIVAAINDYFDRQERLEKDPFLESREKEEAFLKRIEETIERCLVSSNPLATLLLKLSDQRSGLKTEPESAGDTDNREMEDITLDFLSSL